MPSKKARKPVLFKHFSPESECTTGENVHTADASKWVDQAFWCRGTAIVVHHRLYFGNQASRQAKPPAAREGPIQFVHNRATDRTNLPLIVVNEHLPHFAKIVL